MKLTAEETRLWNAWKRATESVRARVAEDIGTATGLSDPDFAILSRLVDIGHGQLRQNDLAASIGWHRSRLSHQLTRMEERGLVSRTEVSGGVLAQITPAGETAIAGARPVHARAVRGHLLELVPRAERERFVAILETLADVAPETLRSSRIEGE